MKTWHFVLGAVLAFAMTASAWAGPRKPSVLLVAADYEWAVARVQSQLLASGVFGAVDTIDATLDVPTAEQLRRYDAVLVWSNLFFTGAAELGNVLADYVDAGGGVVQGMLATNADSPTSANVLQGRWRTDGYNAIASNGAFIVGAATLGMFSDPEIIFEGVRSFNGGSGSFRPASVNVCLSCSILGRWSDNRLLAVSDNSRPGRVDLGFYPPDATVQFTSWDPATDGQKLLVNSLLRVMRPRVLLLHASIWSADVDVKLRATNMIGIIDRLDGSLSTPTPDTLKQYDAVLAFSDSGWLNPIAIGNALADYTDWGGGVVAAQFNHFAGLNFNAAPQGRWASGNYRLLQLGFDTRTPLSLSVRYYPQHPLLAGVNTLTAGVPFAPDSTVYPDGLRIADWSNGAPLVVASRSRANRVDLGMYPPSSSVGSGYWSAATDGGRLMANALVYTVKPYVAIIASDDDPAVNDTRARLTATRRFSQVDSFSARNGTPSAAELAPYGAVLAFSNYPFNDANTLGNRLAALMNVGRGVVLGNFSFLGPNFTPGGAWTPFTLLENGPSNATAASLGSRTLPDHPTVRFVKSLSAPLGFRTTSTYLTGRVAALWTDFTPLVIVSNHLKRVDLNLYPVSSAGFSLSWDRQTDGTRLIANALDWTAGKPPCIGDLNDDQQVDDIDFVLFAQAYDRFVSGAGDFDGNGLTDDVDFVLFAQSYDRFLCP